MAHTRTHTHAHVCKTTHCVEWHPNCRQCQSLPCEDSSYIERLSYKIPGQFLLYLCFFFFFLTQPSIISHLPEFLFCVSLTLRPSLSLSQHPGRSTTVSTQMGYRPNYLAREGHVKSQTITEHLPAELCLSQRGRFNKTSAGTYPQDCAVTICKHCYVFLLLETLAQC